MSFGSPPSLEYFLFLLILVLIHTAIHVRTCCTSCTALEPCIYKYVHRKAAHNNSHSLSSSVLSHETITRKANRNIQAARLTKIVKIAGFREDPGARLLLNAPCCPAGLRACLTAMADGASRDALLNSDMGTPPHIHRAHRDEIDAVSSILPPRAYFCVQMTKMSSTM